MKKKAGKLSLDDMRSMINKSTGLNVAHDLQSDNPTAVKDWIPTGSRWLDSIICKGKMAGIPVGKVTEIAGLSASGKSFMATQIAANAQKKGFTVVYFDAESSIDPLFLDPNRSFPQVHQRLADLRNPIQFSEPHSSVHQIV